MQRPTLPVALLLIAGIAAACTGGGPGASPTAAAPQTIEVTLTDALTIEPAQITVTAGQPVTFVVTNTGATDHEFHVGDEEEQAEHEAEMASMGGMMPHDEPNGIAVEPGATEDLTMTFDSRGETIAGCHFPGHYPSGMRATITITE